MVKRSFSKGNKGWQRFAAAGIQQSTRCCVVPEATLPLRVILPNSKAAIERALHQVDAPYTIGVTRVHLLSDVGKARFATTGTTAEIRQYRRLDDGSLNVVARGQQRFRLRRCWIDVEGVPCGEIQIVKEDSPLQTPKNAFAQLASVTDFRKCIGHPTKLSMFSPVELHKKRRADNDWESASGTSIDSDHSDMDLRISLPGTDSPHKCEKIQECSSSDEDFCTGLGSVQIDPLDRAIIQIWVIIMDLICMLWRVHRQKQGSME
ncbi:hypothetical protein HPP92_026275 [Vanilla planifolia]|uniref:Lon N-terminal domain-containing protein n=1 Tax=Vanilla planifolia TaxID=51239 RepID=A0A835PEW5_VANPL|nr:hypothetical protein HPP92_026275 [Vanilla planifolia]